MALPALVAASLVVAGPWMLDTYTVNILIRAFFVAIAALTVDVLWGFSGTLTFGQSAFSASVAYALAIVFTQFGFGPWQALLALGAAVGVAAAVAGLVGWLSFYPGSTPLYASVISLVLPIVLVQILYSGGTFTGSSSGLVGFESFDLSLENWFRLAGLAVISALIVTWIVLRSDAGRVLGAMRDNDERCSYLGIDTARVRIGLLVVAGVVAALAGFGYVGFGAVAAPENAGFVFGTQLVVMVALGGRGSLIGAVVGAVVIEVASAYLSSSFPFVWELIVGVAFVVVIVVLPGGLFGGLRDRRQRDSPPHRAAPARASSPVTLATLERAGVCARPQRCRGRGRRRLQAFRQPDGAFRRLVLGAAGRTRQPRRAERRRQDHVDPLSGRRPRTLGRQRAHCRALDRASAARPYRRSRAWAQVPGGFRVRDA